MTISKDLFLEILSMDSYNRGYDSGVGDGIGPTDANGNDADGLGRIGAHIGTAVVTSDANSTTDQAAGFYAVAYDSTTYGTIISYRGTDNLAVFGDDASDIYTGWVLSAGELTDQSDLALKFFASAVNQAPNDIYTSPHPDAIVTGHSLGGGLAAMVSALTGTEGVGFDHMPGGLVAAILAAFTEQRLNQGRLQEDPNWIHINAQLDQFRAYHVQDEILESIRNGAIQEWLSGVPALAILALEAFTGIDLDENDLYSDNNRELLRRAIETRLQEAAVTNTSFDTHADIGLAGRATYLHRADLIVLMKYADDNGYTNWSAIADKFHAAYQNVEIAKAAGFEAVAGKADVAAKFGQAIAYSAIDEGTRVFGDTGIRAMFDDLEQLGTKVNQNPAFPGSFERDYFTFAQDTLLTALVNASVQFAGTMAAQKMESQYSPQVLEGIVSFSNGGFIISGNPSAEAQNGDVMHINLSSELWDAGRTTNSPATHAPVELVSWIEAALASHVAENAALINPPYLAANPGLINDLKLPELFATVYGEGVIDRGWNDGGRIEKFANRQQPSSMQRMAA